MPAVSPARIVLARETHIPGAGDSEAGTLPPSELRSPRTQMPVEQYPG